MAGSTTDISGVCLRALGDRRQQGETILAMIAVVRRCVLAGLVMQLAAVAGCARSASFESEARRIGDALPRPVHFVRASGGYRAYTEEPWHPSGRRLSTVSLG